MLTLDENGSRKESSPDNQLLINIEDACDDKTTNCSNISSGNIKTKPLIYETMEREAPLANADEVSLTSSSKDCQVKEVSIVKFDKCPQAGLQGQQREKIQQPPQFFFSFRKACLIMTILFSISLIICMVILSLTFIKLTYVGQPCADDENHQNNLAIRLELLRLRDGLDMSEKVGKIEKEMSMSGKNILRTFLNTSPTEKQRHADEKLVLAQG